MARKKGQDGKESVMDAENDEMSTFRHREQGFAIGKLQVTVTQEFASVRVLIDMHRNHHALPEKDPKRQFADAIVAELVRSVPKTILNTQEWPKTRVVEPAGEGSREKRAAVYRAGRLMTEKSSVEPFVSMDGGTITIHFLTKGGREADAFDKIAAKLEKLRERYPSEPAASQNGMETIIADILKTQPPGSAQSYETWAKKIASRIASEIGNGKGSGRRT